MAAPAWIAGELLASVDATLSSELGGIPYSSSITVNLIYDEAKLGALPEGFGFLVPAVEGRAMLACTFAHRKFLGRTPPGKAVFRAFLGGMKRTDLLAESDEALVAVVRREMREILGAKTISAAVEPEFAQVTRWECVRRHRRAGLHPAGAEGGAGVGGLARIGGCRQTLTAVPVYFS
jgi:oxygen-dependent protoporphyrinogen oxidase